MTQIDYAWDNRALYFVDGAAVYSGFPTGGLPATCTTPPQSPEDEFDTREGCLPYTFDEQSGAVTIGDKAGTFAGGKLTIDGEEYIPLQIPEAGARFTFNEHQHFSFSGMCGMIIGCTTTQQYLSMARGRAVRLDAAVADHGRRPGHRPVDGRRQLSARPARHLRGAGRREDPAQLRGRHREGRRRSRSTPTAPAASPIRWARAC